MACRIRGRGAVRRWLAAAVGAVVLAVVGATPATATAGTTATVVGCDTTTTSIFAVDAASGHLVELPVCRSTAAPGFGDPVEVDAGDWRGYPHLAAVRDGAATVFYAVTEAGELLWHRQESRGAQLGAPARVASEVDWSRFRSVLVANPGYLHAIVSGQGVLTFRHDGWATGGTGLQQVESLLSVFAGPSMSAVRWGSYAEGNANGMHFRIWRIPFIDGYTEHDDGWYFSGYLPAGLTRVVGAEPSLYAVNASGTAVLLDQPPHPPSPGNKFWYCSLHNPMSWQVSAVSAGSFQRLVAPVDHGSGTVPALSVAKRGPDCDSTIGPYEWQAPPVGG